MIFGAGEAGKILSKSINNEVKMNLVGFIDENIELKNVSIDGKPIFQKMK